MKIVYKSFDDVVFENKNECELYEKLEVSKSTVKKIKLINDNFFIIKINKLNCKLLEIPEFKIKGSWYKVPISYIGKYLKNEFYDVKKLNNYYYLVREISYDVELLKNILNKLNELSELGCFFTKNVNYLNVLSKSYVVMEMINNDKKR